MISFRPRLSLAGKISVLSVAGLVTVAMALIMIASSTMLSVSREHALERQAANMRVAWDVLHQYGGDFHVENGQLYVGSHVLNGFEEPVDRIKALVGGTATVFQGDMRVMTNVIGANGKRAIGTALARGPVYDAVLTHGEPFRGEATILGTPYYTAYDPIPGADGRVLGVLYVGVPVSLFMNSAEQAAMWFAGLAGLGTVVAALMVLLVSRRMLAPLEQLARHVVHLASGDTAGVVPCLGRHDELGAMGRAVEVLQIAAVRQRELQAEAAVAQREIETQRARTSEAEAVAATQQAAVVNALANGLADLAAGRFVSRLDQLFAPDYERLRADFNNAVMQLEEMIRAVIGNTTAITSGAAELAQAADDLSRRTEQQAASLKQTSAFLEQVTATVQRTASGATEAREAMQQTRQNADRSSVVVRETVTAMAEIETSSQKVADIIGVIDEIAFQTNLLALNAGVEAARAGDAGRGFAVVASEVRGLSQRTAQAAKEIKSLILASSRQVKRGVGLVGETGVSLERIVAQVNGVTATIAEITASAQEQVTGLREVNAAVNQMDRVTQQNAAMVEESTAASHALRKEAEELTRLTQRFEVRMAA